MTDDYPDLPDFLRITQAERNAAWVANPPKPLPKGFGGRVRTETERLYYASIVRDKAKKRAEDEQRFRELRAKAAAEQAGLATVAAAVKKSRRQKP